MMPRAWAVRNCFQVGPVRRGAGSIPASCRICHTVEAAIWWPSLTSSPCTRRCPQVGILGRDADHELADRGCRGRPPGTPSARVVPLACDQPPVPGEQRRRGHREYLAPPAPGDQLGQCREPQPVGRLVADPADLAAQHRVLVPEHQQLGILGHLTPGQHHQAVEQAAHEQVADSRRSLSDDPSSQDCPARPDRVIEPHKGRTARKAPGIALASTPMRLPGASYVTSATRRTRPGRSGCGPGLRTLSVFKQALKPRPRSAAGCKGPRLLARWSSIASRTIEPPRARAGATIATPSASCRGTARALIRWFRRDCYTDLPASSWT